MEKEELKEVVSEEKPKAAKKPRKAKTKTEKKEIESGLVLDNFKELPDSNGFDVALGAIQKCQRLNVREIPSSSAKIIDILTSNSAFVVIGEYDDYYKIRFKNGKEGYCKKEYVATVAYVN